jgi:Family of unknown function (DUF6082)
MPGRINSRAAAALRESHQALMRLAMDDPRLAEVWGPLLPEGDDDARRAHLYANMVISDWRYAYLSGQLPDDHLRQTARAVLGSPVGHAYWTFAREVRRSEAANRRDRRFHAILDEAWAAVAS